MRQKALSRQQTSAGLHSLPSLRAQSIMSGLRSDEREQETTMSFHQQTCEPEEIVDEQQHST